MADSLKQCPNCPRMVPAHVETCFCGYRFPPPLKWLVEEELRQEPNLDSALITVAAQNGDVTLVGHVPSDDDKLVAETTAKRVPGVLHLVNKLRSDSDIKRAIEKELKREPDLDPARIDVAVEKGIGTLKGLVHGDEHRAVAEIAAKRVPGVLDLVNELWSDSDIKRAIGEELKREPDLDATHITVTVEKGVVILSGRVRSADDTLKVEAAAKRVSGITHVGNELSYGPDFGHRVVTEIPRAAEVAASRAADILREVKNVLLRALPAMQLIWPALRSHPLITMIGAVVAAGIVGTLLWIRIPAGPNHDAELEIVTKLLDSKIRATEALAKGVAEQRFGFRDLAAKAFQYAAENGNAEGARRLAEIHDPNSPTAAPGGEPKPDLLIAYRWYIKARELGGDATERLDHLEVYGKAVVKSLDQREIPAEPVADLAEQAQGAGLVDVARLLFRSAADNGNARAARRLGMIYDPTVAAADPSRQPKSDPRFAYTYYTKAIQMGDLEAKQRLEHLLEWAKNARDSDPGAQEFLNRAVRP